MALRDLPKPPAVEAPEGSPSKGAPRHAVRFTSRKHLKPSLNPLNEGIGDCLDPQRFTMARFRRFAACNSSFIRKSIGAHLRKVPSSNPAISAFAVATSAHDGFLVRRPVAGITLQSTLPANGPAACNDDGIG